MGCTQDRLNASWLPAPGPRICDLFTAEELEEYPRWSSLMNCRDIAQYKANLAKLRELDEEYERRASVYQKNL
jgi:hypothetical protein